MKRCSHSDTFLQGSCWHALLAADMLWQNETLYFRIAREYLLSYTFHEACLSGLSHITCLYTYTHNMCVYIHTYIHTRIRICIHAYIHTQECPSHNCSHNLKHEYKGCWSILSISYQSHNVSQNKLYIADHTGHITALRVFLSRWIERFPTVRWWVVVLEALVH
jgi:hypothetical protein